MAGTSKLGQFETAMPGTWQAGYRKLLGTREGRIALWTVRIGLALITPGLELELLRRRGLLTFDA